MANLFLIQWDELSAKERAKELEKNGWSVTIESEDGSRVHRLIKAMIPNVVVVDISLKPSHGRETAHSLREVKATKDIPIIFVDGDQKAKASTKAKVSKAIFTTSSSLVKLLAKYKK